MQLEFKYRHISASRDLETYVTDHIDKLSRYEYKPSRVEFTFSTEKNERRVDVHLRSGHVELHATAEGDDFFTSIDLALEKLARQLAKQKARVKKRSA